MGLNFHWSPGRRRPTARYTVGGCLIPTVLLALLIALAVLLTACGPEGDVIGPVQTEPTTAEYYQAVIDKAEAINQANTPWIQNDWPEYGSNQVILEAEDCGYREFFVVYRLRNMLNNYGGPATLVARVTWSVKESFVVTWI